jgi:hypothetical protein
MIDTSSTTIASPTGPMSSTLNSCRKLNQNRRPVPHRAGATTR